MAGTNVVVVDRGNNTTCSINLLGATVVSWRVNNIEQLCVSETTRFDQQTEIAGGIEIIFPHYGYWKFGPKHGFARRQRWNLEKPPTRMASNDIEVIFTLQDNEYTKSMWNFPFLITYRLILREKELRFYVNIENKSGRLHLKFDFLLLNYLKVADMQRAQIVGLYRNRYNDKLAMGAEKHFFDRNKFLTLDKEVDRLYEARTHELIVADFVGTEWLEFHKDLFPNILIWRPCKKSTNESSNDGDFNDNEYPTMLCIGTGFIDCIHKLDPCNSVNGNGVIKLII